MPGMTAPRKNMTPAEADAAVEAIMEQVLLAIELEAPPDKADLSEDTRSQMGIIRMRLYDLIGVFPPGWRDVVPR
jgi:hypothetical protein